VIIIIIVIVVFHVLTVALSVRVAYTLTKRLFWLFYAALNVGVGIFNVSYLYQKQLSDTHYYSLAIAAVMSLLAIRAFLDGKDRTALKQKSDLIKAQLKEFSSQHSLWFWEMDKNLRFTYLSEENKAVTGFDSRLYIGRTRLEIAAETKNRDKWVAHTADLEAHKEIKEYAYNLVTSNDKLLRIKINGKPFYDENGTFLGYRGNGRDVTQEYLDHDNLTRSEQQLRAILDNVVEAVIVIDQKSKIKTFNPAAENMFGYAVQDILGQSINILMTGHHHDHHDQYMKNYKQTGVAKILGVREREFEAVRKNGEIFPIELNIAEFLIGSERNFIGTIRDVTWRKDTENKLRQSMQDVKNANQAKSEFLAALSHEFRTPLNSIIGFSELILGRYLGFDDLKFYEEYVKDIHGSSQHLLALVNDVLDLSAIEAGKRNIDIVEIDIKQCLSRCKEIVHGAMDDKDIHFQVNTDGLKIPIFADKRAVMQILINVLSNAIKFTPHGGRIDVRIIEDETHHTLIVADNGQGIPADKLNDLIKPFVMLENNPPDGKQGTGLGLAIVDQLARLHGGSLRLESEVGKGTQVYIKLPKKLKRT